MSEVPLYTVHQPEGWVCASSRASAVMTRAMLRKPLGPLCLGPLGPLGFEFAQHGQTLRSTLDGTRSKALRPFGSQSFRSFNRT